MGTKSWLDLDELVGSDDVDMPKIGGGTQSRKSEGHQRVNTNANILHLQFNG